MPSILTAFEKSKRHLFISTIFICFVSFFSACQKEYSIDSTVDIITDSLPGSTDSLPGNPDSVAIYSLIPDSLNCANVISSGNSEVGMPYTANNFQIILVQV